MKPNFTLVCKTQNNPALPMSPTSVLATAQDVLRVALSSFPVNLFSASGFLHLLFPLLEKLCSSHPLLVWLDPGVGLSWNISFSESPFLAASVIHLFNKYLLSTYSVPGTTAAPEELEPENLHISKETEKQSRRISCGCMCMWESRGEKEIRSGGTDDCGS